MAGDDVREERFQTTGEKVAFDKDELKHVIGKGTCPDFIEFKDNNLILTYDNNQSGLPDDEIVLRGEIVPSKPIRTYPMRTEQCKTCLFWEMRGKRRGRNWCPIGGYSTYHINGAIECFEWKPLEGGKRE